MVLTSMKICPPLKSKDKISYPNPILIYDKWQSLVNSIKENKDVCMRGYETDVHGTHLYQELYKILLNNNFIKKDPTNNTKPRAIFFDLK